MGGGSGPSILYANSSDMMAQHAAHSAGRNVIHAVMQNVLLPALAQASKLCLVFASPWHIKGAASFLNKGTTESPPLHLC